ncbi:MAG TPA: VWA domain-containing protein [Vicinamibacterales bacterium]|nr:VWA domain-containing protein [Vicinamibacterales bacterium]
MSHLLRRPMAEGALALVLLTTVFAQPAAAQANERVLYVNVWDQKTGAPVSGLSTGDFRITEDGAAREVLRVSPATTPMAVVILVDNSQAAAPHIAEIRRALQGFVRALDGIGPIAIVGIADRPTILRDYTTDQKQLEAGIGKVFAMPDSGATLLDAIVEISRGLQKREEDRAAMVLVTTENVEFSTRHYNEVLEELAKGGASLHAVVLNTPAGSSLDDAARNRAFVLDRGPKDSGGTRSDLLAAQAFEAKLKDLAAILKSQQRVVYARPQALIPPKKVEVATTKAGLEASGGPARGQKVR